MTESIEIGIDIGGTFTDAACIINGSRFVISKTSSTPSNLIEGVGKAIDELLAIAGLDASKVTRFAHGTTVATNAVLEQKGAVTGLLTTEGFEDVLAIGRLRRSRLYDLFLPPETPVFLAPGALRVGIRERTDSKGSIVQPLDEDAVRRAVRDMIGQGAQSIAVCYLFSYANPAHELRTRDIVAEIAPDMKVSLSSEIDPVFREYERTCVTAMDAYLRPVMETYIRRLGGLLESKGIRAKLEVMQSRGALTSSDLVARKPVSLVLSGPAAGVAGARHFGLKAGHENLITIDIGGTSSDVSILPDGQTLLTSEGRIDRYPLRVPMVDVSTIGAGGGSIAWLDAAGGLRVGPKSAGASPGPACYRAGGEAATVTDASLVLGYLNPRYFLGGKIALDVDAAHAAIGRLAKTLGKEPIEVASGIHTIINAHMADQVRVMSVGKGHDPRKFVLVMLGGAGPTHGGALMEDLNIGAAMVPPTPGVLAAAGLLVSRIENGEAVTEVVPAAQMTPERMAKVFAQIEESGARKLRAAFGETQALQCTRAVDMRYRKQSHELTVSVPASIDAKVLADIVADFHRLHAQTYGHASTKDEVEFVTFRATHAIPRQEGIPTPDRAKSAGGSSPAAALKETRRAYFRGRGWMETPVYDRQALPLGCRFEGPAIVEQPDTTTVVYPAQSCDVDASGNLILRSAKHAG